MKETEIIEQLPEALATCLANVPRTEIRRIERDVSLSNGMAVDLLVELVVLGRARTIAFEAKASGQPRRAREAADFLRRLAESGTLSGAYGVFAAPYISAGSATICREYGVGHLDLAGNCGLVFEDAYVERTSPENAFRERRSQASIFSPKASRILRILLSEPNEPWQVQRLAVAADVSIGLASKVKQQLQEREWLASSEGGVKLSDPESVLTAWAEQYSCRQSEAREYYSLEGTGDVEAAVAEWCRESDVLYALTGFSGARLSSPRVRYNRSAIYVKTKIDSLATDVNLKPVDSGGNVLLLVPYDDGVFQESRFVYGMRTVSPVQLYLDLRSMPGRGEEAAEEILVRELRPSW